MQNEEFVDTFYTMTNSFPTLSMTTVSSYRTMAWILKLAAAVAFVTFHGISSIMVITRARYFSTVDKRNFR